MMKPVIGVTSSYHDEQTLQVSYHNMDSVTRSGGVPLVLPNLVDVDQIETLLLKVDGLLITGGGDIDPTLFGEEPHPELGIIHPDRDRFEVSLIRKAMAKQVPILAICRGCQIVNIAAGGGMIQDIYTQCPGELLQHRQRAPRSHGSHYIDLEEGSLLHQITGKAHYKVNSFHHQALDSRMAEGFRVTARSSDGIIEAFESDNHAFLIGVQWHPENMTASSDEPSLRLFEAFVKACLENSIGK